MKNGVKGDKLLPHFKIHCIVMQYKIKVQRNVETYILLGRKYYGGLYIKYTPENQRKRSENKC